MPHFYEVHHKLHHSCAVWLQGNVRLSRPVLGRDGWELCPGITGFLFLAAKCADCFVSD